MNREQARRAALTLEDVFTPEGDAVVIASLRTFSAEGDPWASRGQCAQVYGRYHHKVWFPITELTAKEDL